MPAHICLEGQWNGGEHHGQHDQRQADDAQHQIHFDQLAGERAQTKTARQAAQTPLPSSIASKGAMEKIQLSSAQRTKMPSERQMTQALQADQVGSGAV